MTEPLLKTYSDQNIKFKYNEVNASTKTALNAVGATDSLTLRTLGFTPSDSNTIYVAKTGNDSTGDGTSALPVLTIAKALTLCTATKVYIVIKDSGTYEETGIDFTGDCTGIYSALGQTPTLNLDYTYDGSNFTTAVAETTFVGTDAGNKIVEGSAVGEVKILTLSNGNYCILSTLPASGIISIHIINYNNYTQIHEYDLTVEGGCRYVHATELDNGYIFITYMCNDFFCKYWYLYDPTSNTIADYEITASSFLVATLGSPKYMSVCKYEANDNYIFVVYDDHATSKILRGCIYDVMNETVIQSAIDIYTSDSYFWNCTVNYINKGIYAGKYIVSFRNGSAGAYKSSYIVLNDVLWTSALSQIDFITGDTMASTYHLTTPGDNIVIHNLGGSPYPWKYRVFNISDASVVETETSILTAVGAYCGACLTQDGNILFAGAKTSDNTYYYAIIQPNDQYFLKLSKNGVINGIKITSDLTHFTAPLIKNGANDLTLKHCTVYDIEDEVTPSTLISGTGAIDIQNCKIYNCENILTVTSDDVTFKYNAVYFNSNDVQLKITGSGATIDIDHNTFFANYRPIQLISNAGTELVTNNIFRYNTNGAITAATALPTTFTYNCCTDTVVNVTIGATNITYNPMFVNEGTVNEALIDLNLRALVDDYSFDSPCIGTAESSKDIGCYDMDWTTGAVASTYTEITIPKGNIDGDLVSFNQIINELQDGSISKTKDGNKLEVKLKWNGLKNEYANQLIDMFDAEGDIYVYFEPDTNPTTYKTMQIKSDKLSITPKFWKQSSTGVQDVEIVLVGKYN
jgi:hypothetical protein